MATFRKIAFLRDLHKFVQSDTTGALNKLAAVADLSLPQMQGGQPPMDPSMMQGGPSAMPGQGIPDDPELMQQLQSMGLTPDMIQQMSPQELEQYIQSAETGEGPDMPENPNAGAAPAGTVPTLNISAKGDAAVNTVNTMMGIKTAAWAPRLSGLLCKRAVYQSDSTQQAVDTYIPKYRNMW